MMFMIFKGVAERGSASRRVVRPWRRRNEAREDASLLAVFRARRRRLERRAERTRPLKIKNAFCGGCYEK